MIADNIFLSKLSEDDYKLVMKLRRQVGEVLQEFHVLEPNDKVMVCLSGGKDSYAMLDMLLYAQSKAPFPFEIIAVNLDQKQPGFPEHVLPEYLTKLGVNYKIVERDTYTIVKENTPEGKTLCTLCSRLRRGTLYTVAEELGATKVALGHHKDDVLETFFLNLFFSGKMETMPPKYRTDDGKHVVIRPLTYCREKDIARYAELREFPIIPCTLCGSQENMQRKIVKKMIRDWEAEFPNRGEVMFNALQNISPSHMFDRELFDFKTLTPLVDI